MNDRRRFSDQQCEWYCPYLLADDFFNGSPAKCDKYNQPLISAYYYLIRCEKCRNEK